MKKNFVFVLVLAVVMLAGCSAVSNSEIGTLSQITSAELNQSQGAVSLSAIQSSSYLDAGMSENEAIMVSAQLYEEGYLPFMHFRRCMDFANTVNFEEYITLDFEHTIASGVNAGQTLTFDDVPYYRYTAHETRGQMEEELLDCFTQKFAQKNIASLFEQSGYIPMMVEKNGVLYRADTAGMGGTVALAIDTIKIVNLTPAGWTFMVYGIDMQTDEANEEQTWTFEVVQENEGWRIAGFGYEFDDGSGGAIY